MQHAKDILGGLAALLAFFGALAALFISFYMTGEHNRQKVEHLTQVCVQNGFTGWKDEGRESGCYR